MSVPPLADLCADVFAVAESNASVVYSRSCQDRRPSRVFAMTK